MLEKQAITYGEIRGMLTAFALLTFNNVPDIGYTFEFTRLEKQETARNL